MARALGNELAERMVTRRDLDDAVQTLDTTIETAKFDARSDGLERRFEAIDARFDGLESRFDAIDAKLEARHREFSRKFNVLFGTMALGFTLVIGLMGYSLLSPRSPAPDPAAVMAEPQALRIQPPSSARD